MLLEASQKCPVRFSRQIRIFTEDTDSGALDDIFGVTDWRVLADRDCWWIGPSGRDSWWILVLLDFLDLIL